MTTRAGRRRFGSIRRRPSGRYQVRYRGPDGLERSAPETFVRKQDAERYLAMVESQLVRGEWTDPQRATVKVQEYASRWIEERPGLRPRTVDLYRWLLKRHITPHLGGVPLGRLDTPMIRGWRALLLSNGVSQTMAAKAYRLLRAVLTTAVTEDRILGSNPCRVKGADAEKPAERPILTEVQVFELADLMPARYRAFVLLKTFANLRWGEITALQRIDVDADGATVRVRQQYIERRGGGLELGPPKSRAGVRTVAFPRAIGPAVQAHLDSLLAPIRPLWSFLARPVCRSGAATSTS